MRQRDAASPARVYKTVYRGANTRPKEVDLQCTTALFSNGTNRLFLLVFTQRRCARVVRLSESFFLLEIGHFLFEDLLVVFQTLLVVGMLPLERVKLRVKLQQIRGELSSLTPSQSITTVDNARATSRSASFNSVSFSLTLCTNI